MQEISPEQTQFITERSYKDSNGKLYFRAPRGQIIRLTEKPPNKKLRAKFRKEMYKALLEAEQERLKNNE